MLFQNFILREIIRNDLSGEMRDGKVVVENSEEAQSFVVDFVEFLNEFVEDNDGKFSFSLNGEDLKLEIVFIEGEC